MSARLDPSLGSVAPASPPGTLGLAEPVVARPGVARSAPFLLEGERMAVTGTERAGAHAFWWGGHLVAEALTTDAGSGVNVVVAPASLRRELLGPRGTLLELTLVVPTLPLAAVQWQAPVGARWPDGLEVAVVLLPGCSQVRCHVHGEGVRCVADGEGSQVAVELRVYPAPVEWRVGEADGGGVLARASLPPQGPVTLVVASGSPEAASKAMAAAPHLSAHEIRAAADADPAAQETLTTLTGVPGLDHGLVWATARVRGGILRGASSPADSLLWAGLGAVAVGDAAAGAAALEALRRFGADAVPWRLGGLVPADAMATLLAARLTLLSGDPSTALDALGPLGPPGLDARLADAGPEARPLWGFALEALSDALRYAAPEAEIQALRRAAAVTAPRGARFVLPMAGGAHSTGTAAELRRLLGVDGPSHDPGAAWSSWRTLLEQGLDGGPAGRGTWDDSGRPPGAAPEAGLLLCGLAHGLLGLAPDGPSGRIRVAPAFPSHLSAFLARHVRVGESDMDLRYERQGPVHTLHLEPTRGRVPATVVLEPSLLAGTVSGVRVDGAPADLDVSSRGPRTRLKVQLVLDAPRSVEVETEGRAPSRDG